MTAGSAEIIEVPLLSIPGKPYSRILDIKLKVQYEGQLEDPQCDFRPNRNTQDLIFTLRQVAEKTIDYGEEVHMEYIDLEQAFNRVPRKELCRVLGARRVKNNLIQATIYKQRFCETCRNYVRMEGEKMTKFSLRLVLNRETAFHSFLPADR